jgi:hypothetical protein
MEIFRRQKELNERGSGSAIDRASVDLQLEQLRAEYESQQRARQLEFEERARELDLRLQEIKADAKERQTSAEERTKVLQLRWSVDRIRGLVSILLVVGFLSMSGLVIVLGAFGTATTDLLQNVTALYSGVTGAILGYYFGRQQP